MVDVAAVRRNRLRIDAELAAIATEASARNPHHFRDLIGQPQPPARARFTVWRKRFMTQPLCYWPGGGYHFIFAPCVPVETLDSPPSLVRVEACFFDRNGDVAKMNNRPLAGFLPDLITLARLLPADVVGPQQKSAQTPPPAFLTAKPGALPKRVVTAQELIKVQRFATRCLIGQ